MIAKKYGKAGRKIAISITNERVEVVESTGKQGFIRTAQTFHLL